MDLQPTLGDLGTALVAHAVGALIELGESSFDLRGLPKHLIMSGHLGEALDGDARAIAHALSERDAAGGVRRCGHASSPGLNIALLGEQNPAHIVGHATSVPDSAVYAPSARRSSS